MFGSNNNHRHNNHRGRGGRGRGRGGRRGGHRGGGGKPQFWSRMKMLGNVAAHTNVGATKLVFLKERAVIVSAGLDGTVKLFDATGNCTSTQSLGPGVQIGALCAALGWLFVGYKGPAGPGRTAGFVKAFNFNEASVPQQEFKLRPDFPAAHEDQVNDIVVIAEHQMVITGGADGAIRAWKPGADCWTMAGDLGAPRMPGQSKLAHPAPVTAMALFEGRLFSGDQQGNIKAWSVPGNGAEIQSFRGHGKQVSHIIGWSDPMNAQQKVLLTCAHDGNICVWQVAPLAQQQQLGGAVNPKALHTETPRRGKAVLTILPTAYPSNNGGGLQQALICGFDDGTIQGFNLPNFQNLGYLSGHTRYKPITKLIGVAAGNATQVYAASMTGNLTCFQYQ